MIIWRARRHRIRHYEDPQSLIKQVQAGLRNTNVSFDAAQNDVRPPCACQGLLKPRFAARTKRQLLDGRKRGRRFSHFRDCGPQALPVLLGEQRGHAQRRRAFDQAYGIFHDALLFMNGRQQTFLDVHNHEDRLRANEAMSLVLHNKILRFHEVGDEWPARQGSRILPRQSTTNRATVLYAIAMRRRLRHAGLQIESVTARMTKKMFSRVWLWAACMALTQTSLPAKEVVESARRLPVLEEVDVVVIGGTSAGVSAAVAAARKGATVFLAAPRPYLGEDICASYRLWLEPGEEPQTDLAREVFALPETPASGGPSLPFKYTANLPSTSPHKDASPPSKLADGQWQSAANQSVQYNGDVTLLIDLGKEQDVNRINVMTYQRNADFDVASVLVSAGNDGTNWSSAGTIKNDQLGQGAFENAALKLSTAVNLKTRYLKFDVRKGPEAGRVLLGEIVVSGPSDENVAAPTPAPRAVKPMQVKRVLDQALLRAKVPFLYACPATDLLTDANGYPAGVVVANRSGRQAVIAKVIIDATERATVARLAKAVMTDYPGGDQVFTRVVVGGKPTQHDHLIVLQRPQPLVIYDRAEQPHSVIEYQLKLPMKDASFASFSAAEQLARDWTWTPQALDASEVLFQVPPGHILGKQHFASAWPGADQLPLDALRPAESEQVFVLSGCADVSREVAAKLERPVNAMAVGERVGEKAAELAASLAKPQGVQLAGFRRQGRGTWPNQRSASGRQSSRRQGNRSGRSARGVGAWRIRRGGGGRRHGRRSRRNCRRTARRQNIGH